MMDIRDRLARDAIAKDYHGCSFNPEGVVGTKTPKDIWEEEDDGS